MQDGMNWNYISVDEMSWNNISSLGNLSDDFIRNNINNIDIHRLICYQQLPLDIIEKYYKELNHSILSRTQNLPDKFILDHLDSLNINLLLENNKISNHIKEYLRLL